MTQKRNIQDKLPEFLKEAWTNASDAIGKTETEVKKFVNNLIERGKMTPEDGKKVLSELVEKINVNRKKLEKRAGEGFEKTLHKINMPTKNELDTLNKRVSDLGRKIHKLKKEIAA